MSQRELSNVEWCVLNNCSKGNRAASGMPAMLLAVGRAVASLRKRGLIVPSASAGIFNLTVNGVVMHAKYAATYGSTK